MIKKVEQVLKTCEDNTTIKTNSTNVADIINNLFDYQWVNIFDEFDSIFPLFSKSWFKPRKRTK